MKNRVLRICLLGSIGVWLVTPWSLTAQTTSAPAAPAPPASTENSPVRLPYGVEDVLKLTRAQISEDITLNYIQNSGTIYNLGPQDIVYLRNQGVSDRVINAMLDQRKKTVTATTPPATDTTPTVASSVPNAPTVPDAPTVPAAPTYTQPAPTYVQPPAPEVQPAPSTVYVMPYPPASYAYYGYYSRPYGYYPYPYYGGYYYGGPAISFGFRFGGGYGHYGHYGHSGYYGHYGHSGGGHWHR